MKNNQFSIQRSIKILIVILFVLSSIGLVGPIATGQSDENLPPVSNVYLDPTRHPVINSVKVMEQVYFIGEDSYDPNPEDNLTFYWNFGDGSSSSKVSPTHVYPQVGEFLISLTVNDSRTSSTTSVIILVYTEGGNDPIPSIWLDANRDEKGNNLANVSDVIQFDASGSYDPDGSQLSYDWDFGDGVRSGNKIATHEYKEEGIFTVILSITDEEQLVGVESVSIRIGEGKSTNGQTSNNDQSDVYGFGVTFLIIVIFIVVLLVLIWMYLGRLRRRTLARSGSGNAIIDEESRISEKPAPKSTVPVPDFKMLEVKKPEQKSRSARMDRLARSEAKLKQAMLRKKLQDERKKLDDDMKKELEDLGIEL
jgi:hypothetical protein